MARPEFGYQTVEIIDQNVNISEAISTETHLNILHHPEYDQNHVYTTGTSEAAPPTTDKLKNALPDGIGDETEDHNHIEATQYEATQDICEFYQTSTSLGFSTRVLFHLQMRNRRNINISIMRPSHLVKRSPTVSQRRKSSRTTIFDSNEI